MDDTMHSAPPPDTEPAGIPLARRIRETREQRGQSQEDLAGPELTAGYIAAVEQGAVRPSRPALEYLAQRLDLPLAELQAAPQEPAAPVDLAAVAEDLRYQANCALLLIRQGQPAEGLALIAGAEAHAGPYLPTLPA